MGDGIRRRTFVRTTGAMGVLGAASSVSAATRSDCGNTTETDSVGGQLASGESDTYTFRTDLATTCRMTYTLGGDPDADVDFDLYLTMDGRVPTTDDYDRRSNGPGSPEEIVVEDSISPSSEFGVLVDAYDGSGRYALRVEETGSNGADGNDAPTARIAASTTTPAEGEAVELDASATTDPEGEHTIESYRWMIPEGLFHPTYKEGEVVSHAFSNGGQYDVELRVVDSKGQRDSATVTINVDGNWWPFW